MFVNWPLNLRSIASPPSEMIHLPERNPTHRTNQDTIFSTISWQDLPLWQQDNEFILRFYRQESGSYYLSLRSLGYIHNETVNIFSHLFGAILFIILAIYTYCTLFPRYASAQAADIVVFSTFFFGVATCFALSAHFHIVADHSEKVAARGNQLDYIGIVILMWGSTIPSVYYGFFCDPKLQKVYWAIITTLATACITATLHPVFRRPRFRPYRAAMYSGLGLSALVFIVHGIAIHGWAVQSRRMSLVWMGVMALLNLLGVAIFASRVPERWVPGRHDILGNSHQIFHFMVLFAGLAHMVGLLKAFDYLHSQASPCI